MTRINGAGRAFADSLIANGHVNKTAAWSFSAEDGNALLGASGDDWANYGKHHLGVDTSANENTKDRFKYPFAKGGTLYRSALEAIRQRAGQQGDSAIFDAAGALLKKIDGGKERAAPLREYRTFAVLRGAVDEQKRTAEISYSSEAPYERWWGTEILGHAAGECDMSWMCSGTAPLLVDHNTKDVVGVIENASIGPDRRGRAVARFGRSARAEEVFRDVIDGIRANVSVGYEIRKMVLVE
jgi:hypothetical protein